MKAISTTLAVATLSLATLMADQNPAITTPATTENGITTERTTISSGTLTEFSPGTTFIVKEAGGAVTYSYGKQVVYATKSGRVLTDDEVRARIRVGLPVSVHYVTQGDARVINRVIVDDD